MTRIYIASSWKNAEKVRGLSGFLREEGNDVFDFTDPEWKVPGLPDHFVFNASKWFGTPLNEIDWLDFLKEPITEKAFNTDKAGIDWADLVILLVPSGRSSHLEAGYAVGCGKPLFIYGDLPGGEFDVMYHFAEGCYREKDLGAMLRAMSSSGNMKPGENR